MAMSFNTALSGLNASSTDLSVIGNNIANANTTGFKFSRTEFADLYSASLRTYSGARIGTGVKVSGVVQQFTQGNANTTDQSLDLAIAGDGFFRVTDAGNQNPLYTRNGAFHLDLNNDIVNSQGQYLNAYQADPKTGQIIGTINKVNIDQSDIAPAPTTRLTATMNLNAGDVFPTATTSLTLKGLQLNAQDTTPTNTFNANDSTTYNTKASTTIYDSKGVAHTATQYFVKTSTADTWDMHTVVDGINGVQGGTEVFPDPANPTTAAKLIFDPSTGALTGTTPVQLKYDTLITPNGGADALSLTIGGLTTATQTAGETLTTLALDTNATLPTTAFNPTDPASYTTLADRPAMIKDSNGVPHDAHLYFVSNGIGSNSWTLHTIVDPVDANGSPVTPGQEVFPDPNNPVPVTVTANPNGTLNTKPTQFQYTFASPGGATPANPLKFSIKGLTDSADAPPTIDTNGNTGKIWTAPTSGNLPDPTTYNYSTSTTIYDSQGSSHLAAMYFVKTGANVWDMHTFVDGLELDGSTITPPNTQPNGTGSPITLNFDNNGALLSTVPAPIPPATLGQIPLTATMANGAASINFAMDIGKTTQYGSPNGISSVSQDGYTTGHISSINVDDDGTISSLFTNGRNRVLGQVVMTNFANVQGLRPVGNTEWAESSISGQALLVRPSEAGTGTIQSGALEASNVDLTKQLVDMIVSQRSFQANSQVISAVDTLTQTIVNLR
ncbi:Flagellar hook protein FlgE [Gammaproteobacteria bacterium]